MSPIDPFPSKSGMDYPLTLSVVICTHNPYKDYLRQTVTALSAQTLPVDQWELIIIDNLSDPPIAPDLARIGHPQGRVVVEPELGVANARARGILETKGRLILFVDDDNLLTPDYFETAIRIGAERPFLGAWGAAKILPRFEGTPSPEILPFTKLLSLRDQDEELWSNLNYIVESSPMGAGMCFRAEIGRWWTENTKSSALRRSFGRRGVSLGACEDSDIALASSAFGMGHGIFPSLRITHLIPPKRYGEEFLLNNVYGWGHSVTLFDTLRRPNRYAGESRLVRWLRLRAQPFLSGLFQGRFERKINATRTKGIYDALNELDAMAESGKPPA